MSTGKVYLYSGLGLLIVGFAMIILSLVEGSAEPWMLGKIGGSFLWGSIWIRAGRRKIAEEELIKAMKSVDFDFEDFQNRKSELQDFEYMNCQDCRFFINSKCTRKPAPIKEKGYCLSSEAITEPSPTS